MKFQVNKNLLLDALQKLTNAIGSRTTLPVLANVFFEAAGDALTLTTTDLEVRVTTTIDATVEREGKTTLPGKKFLSLVSKFSDDAISMDCNERHHTAITCGTASFKLLGLSDDDFPLPTDFDPVRRFKVNEGDLSRMLDQISYAVSLDDSRKVLHGIFLSIKENTLTSVATDGKRLALVEHSIDDYQGEDGDAILPLKSAQELKRLLGKDQEVSVAIGENQISFETAKSMMTSKLIEGTYPNYRQVIPTSFTKEVEVSPTAFLDKLDLVAIAISDSGSFIQLQFKDNRLSFEATSTDVGEGRDYLDINYDEQEITISFNPVFLADPFRHASADKVLIKLNDGFSPVGIVGDEGFLYVIMPMRNK